MAWADETTLLSSESVSDTEEFGTGVTLSPGEQAHIQVKCVRGGTTDDLYIRVYSQVDDTNYDTEALYSFTLETANDATAYISFVMSGIYGFKVGVESAGATDDHVITILCKKDGVSL